MKTCNGDLGTVISPIWKITLDWLVKHTVPYHEIYFGKPWAEIYIDDNGFRFENWGSISSDGKNLPISKEKQKKNKK